VAFCDLTAACDKMWLTGLLYKLSQCDLHESMLQWMHAYLNDQCFQVLFEDETSLMKTINSGVPQRAIFYLHLFNAMMRDLLS
jgi:hypothetical protein